MGRVSGGREKAMKGKDEESGLEKRQNREVGQRQATSVFCVQRETFPCVPVLYAADRHGTRDPANDTAYGINDGFVFHILLFRIWCCGCNRRYFTCPPDRFIKSDTCQRICVDTSANYHVNGVSLDFALCCKYLFASRCQGWYPGIEPTDKTGACTDVQPLHLGERSNIWNFTRPAHDTRSRRCLLSQPTTGSWFKGADRRGTRKRCTVRVQNMYAWVI